jgi:hypothetical protein
MAERTPRGLTPAQRERLQQTRATLTAYAQLGASAYWDVIRADLEEGLGKPMPRLADLLSPDTPRLPEGVYQAEIWIREGERQMVKRLCKLIADAPAFLEQLAQGGASRG